MGYYMRIDLDLPKNTPVQNMPDILVENLNFSRVISGRKWQVNARGAEREADTIRADNMEIKVSSPEDERNSVLRASSGEFSEASSKVWLREVSGFLLHKGRSIDITAPAVAYDSSSDMWFFSEGIQLSDDSTLITGGTAKINQEGVYIIGRGATACWKIK
jgi:hypothetical protein